MDKLNFYFRNPLYILYRIKLFFKNDLKNKKIIDDFDWDLYTTHYKGELKESESVNLQLIETKNYSFKNNELTCNIKNALILHPNHHALYESILILNPKNIIEFGCGGGDHLKNLNILNNKIELNAFDRSIDQIKLLNQRHPNLNANILIQNITDKFELKIKCDISYSQAVLMHIKEGYVQALENMFNSAINQVVLMENWYEHNYFEDINKLVSEKRIKWKNTFLYTHSFDGAKALIASRVKLPYFKPLTKNNQLL